MSLAARRGAVAALAHEADRGRVIAVDRAVLLSSVLFER
jgi:hypothetical protein